MLPGAIGSCGSSWRRSSFEAVAWNSTAFSTLSPRAQKSREHEGALIGEPASVSGRTSLVFGPPPVPATRRGSAAAASGNGLRIANRDLVSQPLVELLTDPLDLDQVLRLAERLLGSVLDDRLGLRGPDPGEPRELFRARGVQID